DDPECRAAMFDVMKYWVLDGRADGYRMDVYWGPQNRYGTDAFWGPFRDEIKRVKPDILILGETDGTGAGSENNYADHGGASDAAYDWNLFWNGFRAAGSGSVSVATVNALVTNYGYSPGANSFFFRFLENHDETRIASRYSLEVTKALAALLFTAQGLPMIYAGGEIGWTGQRNLIQFGDPYHSALFQYYRRLTRIRETFPALRGEVLRQVATNQSTVYAYVRPQRDQNLVVALNLSGNPVDVTLAGVAGKVDLSAPFDPLKVYYFNDVLNDTTYSVAGGQIQSFSVMLAPWRASVMLLSDSVYRFTLTGVQQPTSTPVPQSLSLFENYPNPFNPTTTIVFDIPEGSSAGGVSLRVFDLLGRHVALLADGPLAPGRHSVVWNGRDAGGRELPTGVYFYRLTGGGKTLSRRMMIAR
ncbi:MAG: hypothetical protein COS95_05520, partial [Ignavibacteriales bacterium CG07_land_8_20_14_0_80_59_12]